MLVECLVLLCFVDELVVEVKDGMELLMCEMFCLCVLMVGVVVCY